MILTSGPKVLQEAINSGFMKRLLELDSDLCLREHKICNCSDIIFFTFSWTCFWISFSFALDPFSNIFSKDTNCHRE